MSTTTATTIEHCKEATQFLKRIAGSTHRVAYVFEGQVSFVGVVTTTTEQNADLRHRIETAGLTPTEFGGTWAAGNLRVGYVKARMPETMLHGTPISFHELAAFNLTQRHAGAIASRAYGLIADVSVNIEPLTSNDHLHRVQQMIPTGVQFEAESGKWRVTVIANRDGSVAVELYVASADGSETVAQAATFTTVAVDPAAGFTAALVRHAASTIGW